jgi:hypothetical protein
MQTLGRYKISRFGKKEAVPVTDFQPFGFAEMIVDGIHL